MFELIEKIERRLYEDEFAYADRAAWLEHHGIKTDRRKPRNIITENNRPDGCCCNQAEES